MLSPYLSSPKAVAVRRRGVAYKVTRFAIGRKAGSRARSLPWPAGVPALSI